MQYVCAHYPSLLTNNIESDSILRTLKVRSKFIFIFYQEGGFIMPNFDQELKSAISYCDKLQKEREDREKIEITKELAEERRIALKNSQEEFMEENVEHITCLLINNLKLIVKDQNKYLTEARILVPRKEMEKIPDYLEDNLKECLHKIIYLELADKFIAYLSKNTDLKIKRSWAEKGWRVDGYWISLVPKNYYKKMHNNSISVKEQ